MGTCSYFHTMETKCSLPIRLKQWVVIEFLAAGGYTPKEIHVCLKNIYGRETIDISSVQRWVANAKK